MVDIQAILRHKKLSTTELYIHRLGALKPVLKVLSGKKVPLAGTPELAEAKQGVALES